MNSHDKLIAAYRRRKLYVSLGVAVAASGIGLAYAQTPATPAPATPQVAPPAQAAPAPNPQNPAGGRRQGRRNGAGNGAAPGGNLTIIPAPGQTPGAAPAPGQTPGADPGRVTIPTNPGSFPRIGGQGGARGGSFSFDFRGSDISNVLKLYSQLSGLTITTDAALTGPVTIIAPRPVTLDEAFKILQSVLYTRGFTAQSSGNVLSILPLERSIGNATIVGSGTDKTKLDPRNQVMTQVIPLDNVEADALANELKPLINKGASLIGSNGSNALIMTDTASNVQRFIDLVAALDKTSNRSEMKIYPLQRADAQAVADIVNNLYHQTSPRGNRGGQGQGGQPQQQQIPGQQGGGPPTASRPSVVAVADTRTNSVIIVASPDNQDQIAATIINRLDGAEGALETKIRKIRYADANTVANLVSNVLSNARAGASTNQGGGSSFSSRVFGGFDPTGGNGGQQSAASSDPFGKVVADQRTNSLLITASPDRMIRIDELIDQLDVDVPVETTTFVIPLKNAQAADVAAALNQAFGTGSNGLGNGNVFINGGGGANNRNGSNSSNNRQPINRRQGSTPASPFGRSATRPPGPPNAPDGGLQGDSAYLGQGGGSAIPQGVAGVMTQNGFVPTQTDATEEPTRQFGGFFGGFGGQRRGVGQSQSPQFGRGAGGSQVNLLQLQNNVFVTASPNGDSIIVTTTPDNYQAIQGIVSSLDIIPRQVMIEVIVAEVSLDSDQKLGFTLNGILKNLLGQTNGSTANLNLPGAGFGVTQDPNANGAQFSLTGANYGLLLQALQTDSRVKVLSKPRIFASNNQQADFNITTNIPYVTAQNVAAGVTNVVSNTVQYLQVGIQLTVTPRITSNGQVTVDLSQSASDLLGFDIVGTGASALRAPRYNDRVTDTSVTIQNDETIVIGGMIRDNSTLNVNKIPVLADIPLIGQFFRSREVVRGKTELLIFMTPHIVQTAADAREMTRKTSEHLTLDMPALPQQQPNLDYKKQDKKRLPKAMPMPQQTPEVKPNSLQPQVSPPVPPNPAIPQTIPGG